MPARSRECRKAKGKVISDPPKFRQKINVKIGMALIAIKGPDVPIPMIPRPIRIRSGLAGIAV